MRFIVRRLPLSPSVQPLHAVTYLLAVPLFSIAFLVFLNSSLSFLLTNRFHVPSKNLGNIVGTLGFVDELVAIVAAPLWGVISDGRIGTRGVSSIGYFTIALSLVLFVEIENVYPGLIFGRILFSLGAAAVTTMVSAILPEMTHPAVDEDSPVPVAKPPATGQLAGLVGLFTGFGALLALGLFLPLPTRFSKYHHVTPAQAVQISYFIVAGIAAAIAVWCYFGLPPPRNPSGSSAWRNIKTWVWTRIWGGDPVFVAHPSLEDGRPQKKEQVSGIQGLLAAAKLAVTDGRIGVAYVGGFVARASSVGVSLFIPLFVNHYFVSRGLCKPTVPELSKDQCNKAYILASTLTGTSQLTALLLAPFFGLLTDRLHTTPYLRNVPLILSSILGIIGFTLFSLLPSPSSPWAFVFAALAGASQIGAIVSSLGLLSRGIVETTSTVTTNGGESAPLLGNGSAGSTDVGREAFKGSIAGVYSLFGAGAILLLTKAGGKAFDSDVGAPFWMLAGFNGILAIAAVGNGIWTWIAEKRR
ncbi:major facilitator superfamily domain-containing protein [Sphaerosporella brunnea]|uniref:Major facilitator superfamily domain-containing protein n=1 Tax=Sphaerosporella brunnea TaxID=1250544 RepID=A0A5J5EEP6_9PEZI|nr:major facilitator superfamily domain-containing protein [Sphaerosporella brunnea]